MRRGAAVFARLLSVALALEMTATPAARAGSGPAAPIGRSYFFATRDACNASGVFTRQECAMAFSNALAALRDRAPSFASVVECRIRFALCEPRRDRAGYSPVGLGIEIILSARGPRVTPAMAVETPASLFPQVPITTEYVARAAVLSAAPDASTELGDSDILPSDRFEPFAKRPQIKAQFSFNYASLGEIDGGRRDSQETPEQRRARLRAAPLVQ